MTSLFRRTRSVWLLPISVAQDRPSTNTSQTVNPRPAGPSSGRLHGVDSLRGLAIILMVAANSGAEVMSHPHPFAFRLVGSLAAPIFVMLAGMMVAVTTTRDRARADGPRHGMGHYLGRAAFLFLVAMLIEVGIEQYLPALTCDVLYLIAISLPIAYLLSRATFGVRWLVPVAIFAVTPWLQVQMGYRLRIGQPLFENTGWMDLPELISGAVRRYLIDGWFPLFPWLGYALLGAAIGTRPRTQGRGLAPGWKWGAGVLAIGIVLWRLYPGAMVQRNGYTELFYPVTIGFALTTIGAFLLLLDLAERYSEAAPARFLRPLGQCSLFLYITHLAAIQYIWRPLADDLPLGQFLGLYLGFLAILWLVAIGVNYLKRACRETGYALPGPISVLLGA